MKNTASRTPRPIDEPRVRHFQQIEPAGYGNPAPLLAACDLTLVSPRRVGADGAHLKFQVTDGGAVLDCIAFRQGDWFGTGAAVPHRIDLAFAAEINEWNGERRVQPNVKDMRPA